jgi:hypothetical protein
MVTRSCFAAVLMSVCVLSEAGPARAQGSQGSPAIAEQPSALSPANIAKPRPKAPFDLTGTWQHDGREYLALRP